MLALYRFALAAVLALGASAALAAEPTFTLTEDGAAFLYRARPGDQPGTVAAMFGIASQDVPAFLAANGITDPTRVAVGHEYRIPNPLAARAAAAEATAAALERQVAEMRTRSASLERELGATREAAETTAGEVSRLAWLARAWPIIQGLGALLVLACGFALAVAVAAARKQAQAERFARSLADDLDEKRRAALAERQEAAKRVLDLEAEVRELQLGSRAPMRRHPAGAR